MRKRVGAGERRNVEPEAFFSIPYSDVSASGIPYDWSILTILCKHLRQSLGFARAESNKYTNVWNPPI